MEFSRFFVARQQISTNLINLKRVNLSRMYDISNISHSPDDLSRGTFCVQLVQLYFLTYALTLIKDVLAKVVIDQARNRMMLPSVYHIAISTYLYFLSFDVVSYNARD